MKKYNEKIMSMVLWAETKDHSIRKIIKNILAKRGEQNGRRKEKVLAKAGQEFS